MGAKTNYAENQFIDTFIRGQAKPSIPNWYVGLAMSTAGVHAVSTAFSLNDTVFIADDAGKYHLYKCTSAGTTAATKPSYPGVNNEVVTDGTAVFTDQHNALEDATGIIEPSGGSYARVSVPASLANWAGTQSAGSTVASAGTLATTSNNSPINFVDPTANWGTVGLFVLFDAVSAGNAWIVGALNSPLQITSGMTNVQFAAGALVYTEDD